LVKCAEFKYFCDCWDSLQFNSDELLTITLATGAINQEQERVVCPFPLCKELIWDIHKKHRIVKGNILVASALLRFAL